MPDHDAGENTTTPSLEQRLEALFQELRRQGRASVAAQAAAEACLEALERGQAEPRDDRSDAMAKSPPRDVAAAWLGELLPVFDGLSRALTQARHLETTPALWERVWRPGKAKRAALATLTEGLALLEQQLREALDHLGVHVEAPVSGPANPERHRVVEVRSSGPGRPGHVVELVRPGYVLGDRLVREAEVAVRR